MSVSTTANPQRRRGAGKLWLGILLLIAAGVALAWIGAGSLRARDHRQRPRVPHHRGRHRPADQGRATAS